MHTLKMFSLAFLLLLAACRQEKTEQKTAVPATTFQIAPNMSMADLASTGSPSLQQAAAFAWSEFVDLNWPALPGTRDQLDPNKLFGQPGYTGPLVWQTYRAKVEIFPGQGAPHGDVSGATDYGYNDPPKYVYGTGVSKDQSGLVAPCSGQAPVVQPAWINLDEISEIGLDQMFAGVAAASPPPGQQILFMAKGNKTEYTYVAGNQWYGAVAPPFSATATYVANNKSDPPAGGSTYVSFNNGTIEVKAAWRRLTATEQSSGRFATQTVRYYETNSSQLPCYREEQWGLLALHIIQKTPSTPYFIFATFEQADNILTPTGGEVEDVNGNLIANQSATPMNPNITSQNATSANPANLQSIQQLSPSTANCQPQQQIYYLNSTGMHLPQGNVCVQRRIHTIPQTIIDVNTGVHGSIQAYNQANGITSSPWLYYKLVNVQAAPINKPTPGVDYSGPDAPTYYQANSVVETDYNLQVFSGHFQPTQPNSNLPSDYGDLITDFNNDGTPFYNVYFGGNAYNMGGCMGCHGNIQGFGADFSFIMAGQRVSAPETVGPAGVAAALKRFKKLFLNIKPATPKK